jgi:hypothetical protein
MTLWAVIPLLVAVAAISFYLGVRYCARTMLPVLLARMPQKDLNELSATVAKERFGG